MKTIIRKLLTFILFFLGQRRIVSTKYFCKYLRKRGAIIGDNLIIMDLFVSKCIDSTRPTLVEIGNNVFLNDNFRLFTHDYVSHNFLYKYHEFLPSSGKVKIGNNVAFGQNCTVLKGVSIGDNCFIGAGSIVTKDIPNNSIAVGVPAKVICSMDEYHKRRISEIEAEAIEYARSIYTRLSRTPIPKDFKEEFPLFIDKSNIAEYPEIPVKSQLGHAFDTWWESHHAKYASFDEFLKVCNLNNKDN